MGAPLHSAPADAATRFAKIAEADLAAFAAFLGAEHVHHSPDTLQDYSHDWTEDLRFPPEVVLKPADTQQVSAILRYCNERRIPVTPVGGRTGLSGGMLPVYGGVALALERMNRIVALDTANLQMTVEPGVVVEQMHQAAEAAGLMYPPDPSSKGSCFIGGNLAENAGGAHAVKYGITNAHVLALEVVLASGEVIRTGANVLKNSTGYNLTQLMVGSEGTLGVITQSTHKLLPLPRHVQTLLGVFPEAEAAIAAVSHIFQAKLVPSTLEFIEKDAIDFGQAYLGIRTYDTTGVGAHLLVEFDGNDADALFAECARCAELLEHLGAREVLFADSSEQRNELWRLRRCLGEAVKGNTIYKEEDTVVPRAALAQLLRFVKAVGAEYGFQSVCYGHAGDGNLHVNIIKGDLDAHTWEVRLPEAIRRIFEYTVSLGGTLSGEHGIGWVQRGYMDIRFSPAELALMRGIKQVFDPNGILNPGKIW